MKKLMVDPRTMLMGKLSCWNCMASKGRWACMLAREHTIDIDKNKKAHTRHPSCPAVEVEVEG